MSAIIEYMTVTVELPMWLVWCVVAYIILHKVEIALLNVENRKLIKDALITW